jgi:gentisate 1,2-dioxygenase
MASLCRQRKVARPREVEIARIQPVFSFLTVRFRTLGPSAPFGKFQLNDEGAWLMLDRPHRHTAAAINYYFQGSGRSTVGGEVYEWKAGDLMLSAPGWAVHNHGSYDDYVYELTIQDQPLNIAMESLLWQESLKLPLAVLGVEEGLGTNRAAG